MKKTFLIEVEVKGNPRVGAVKRSIVYFLGNKLINVKFKRLSKSSNTNPFEEKRKLERDKYLKQN